MLGINPEIMFCPEIANSVRCRAISDASVNSVKAPIMISEAFSISR